MAEWSKPVYSTMVSEVAYDDETQLMTITWKNGKRTVYEGVPEDKASELAGAPSVGQMINSEIKGKYNYRNG